MYAPVNLCVFKTEFTIILSLKNVINNFKNCILLLCFLSQLPKLKIWVIDWFLSPFHNKLPNLALLLLKYLWDLSITLHSYCHYPASSHHLFPGGASGKEPCQCRRHKRGRFSPWVGKILGRRAWQPTPAFLPGESPWTVEPVGLQSIELQRVGHDWSNLAQHTERHTNSLVRKD